MNTNFNTILVITVLAMGLTVGLLISKGVTTTMIVVGNDVVFSESQLTFQSILINNFWVCVINILGFLSLGLMTLVNTFYNGLVFGNVIAFIYRSDLVTVWNFIPHAIPEIVAIIYSAKIGLCLGVYVFNQLYDSNITIRFFNYPMLKKYSIVVISSLIIGTIIEIYISPYL
ncbi:MAG: stage II sporulation protein M [Balneolales bacterium]|nr:stage II sporulation protein M [Balneolales bacterium]